MEGYVAITVIMVILAFSDVISNKTKSILSSMLVASIVFLFAFWGGLPGTIFQDAQLLGFGSVMIGFLITHMGTLLSLEDLKKQWKTVVIAVAAIAGIGVFLTTIGAAVIGREYAIASAPPLSGGVVAGIIMQEAADKIGRPDLKVYVTMILILQSFVGLPVASFFLNKEGKKLLTQYKINGPILEPVGAGNGVGVTSKTPKIKKKLIPELPKQFQTTYILLAKLAVCAFIGFKLAALTNGVIHKYVMCLFVGVVGSEIGFLEKDIMTKANSFGLAMVALMAAVFGSLAAATPQMIASLAFPIVGALLIGVVGIAIFAIIAGKIVKASPYMAIAIGCTALFGFPGTFILSNEVANAVGSTEEEKKYVLDNILPQMLVAGFITVTIGSVIFAGIMAPMLV